MSTLLTPDARAGWLAERKTGLGASDAAAVLGLSPWSSPMEVWLEKTGRLLGDDSPSEAMEWGLRLEDAIAQKWEESNGLRLDRVITEDGRPQVLRHHEHPWMLCTLDRRAADDNPFEAKTANGWNDGWDPDLDIIPDHVRVQQQHQLAVTGADRCYGAVLIGGHKFRTWIVERDDALISDLIVAEERFWTEHVLADRPPAMDGSAATTEALKALWPESDGTELELPLGAEDLLAAWQEAKAVAKAAEEESDRLANQIKALLGDHEAGLIDGRKAVTWKSSARASYTVAETTVRQLRLTRVAAVTSHKFPIRSLEVSP